MASISGISKNPLDMILPTYGNPRQSDAPIWDENQHMFITNQYTSAAGNTYYMGVRIADKFVTILHIGLYHTWTYLDEVEIYVFDGREKLLAGKKKLDKQFYSDDLARAVTQELMGNYIQTQMQMTGTMMSQEDIENHTKMLVEKSYLSMVNDPTVSQRLSDIKPLLIQK